VIGAAGVTEELVLAVGVEGRERAPVGAILDAIFKQDPCSRVAAAA
jgi:hypothetical protein